MADNKISPKLATRLQRNAQHVLVEKQRNIAETDVELLHLVSEPLRVELHTEEYSKVLCQHPFFEKFSDDYSAAMRQICHTAVSAKGPYEKGDVLFSVGEVPEK